MSAANSTFLFDTLQSPSFFAELVGFAFAQRHLTLILSQSLRRGSQGMFCTSIPSSLRASASAGLASP